jgi:dienelactone hydrolase
MARKRKKLVRGAVVTIGALAVAAAILWALVGEGGLYLMRFREGDDTAGSIVFTAEEMIARLRDGRDVPVRVYVPPGGHERVVLVIHGVHHGGYDEARLVYFAKRLVEAGFAVVTPELADLKRYEITARTVDDIEELARWTAALPLVRSSRRDARIGLVGISFGGGLAISAVGRLDAARAQAFVFAFGGHGDLRRTMRFLASGERTADGWRAPHPYGQAVELRMFADRLVPAADVEGLRAALLAYLEDRRPDAERIAAGAGPEARKLVRLCLDGKSKELGPILAPFVERFEPAPSLSPSLEPAPACPVFLLHGAEDNVIPASETTALAASLERRGAEVHALVTDLIQHVELKKNDAAAEPPLSSYWRMARFWTELLGE